MEVRIAEYWSAIINKGSIAVHKPGHICAATFLIQQNQNKLSMCTSDLVIYIFATSVETETEVALLQPSLDHLAGTGWSFDLEDCDRVLRVDCPPDIPEIEIAELLRSNGFRCEPLV